MQLSEEVLVAICRILEKGEIVELTPKGDSCTVREVKRTVIYKP